MPVQEQLEIRSTEAGAFLLIQRDGRGSHDDLNDGYWMAALSVRALHAALRFYEIELGGLAGYFAALAVDWGGWNGQRR